MTLWVENHYSRAVIAAQTGGFTLQDIIKACPGVSQDLIRKTLGKLQLTSDEQFTLFDLIGRDWFADEAQSVVSHYDGLKAVKLDTCGIY